MAMHSALLSSASEHAELTLALRTDRPLEQPRLQALREFTRAIVRSRGRVPDATWSALQAAGFTREETLDIVLGVGVYMLSTLGNVLTEAQLDPPFAPFAWRTPPAD